MSAWEAVQFPDHHGTEIRLPRSLVSANESLTPLILFSRVVWELAASHCSSQKWVVKRCGKAERGKGLVSLFLQP